MAIVLLLLVGKAMSRKKYIIQPASDGYDLSHSEPNKYVHKPYHFGYHIKDGKGNSQWHKEQSDENNYRKGSYGYTDAYGIYRHVDYIADHEGFRAKIRSNEPGVESSHPAHVHLHAEPTPHHYEPTPHHYEPTTHHYEPTPHHYAPNNYAPSHYAKPEYEDEYHLKEEPSYAPQYREYNHHHQ